MRFDCSSIIAIAIITTASASAAFTHTRRTKEYQELLPCSRFSRFYRAVPLSHRSRCCELGEATSHPFHRQQSEQRPRAGGALFSKWARATASKSAKRNPAPHQQLHQPLHQQHPLLPPQYQRHQPGLECQRTLTFRFGSKFAGPK